MANKYFSVKNIESNKKIHKVINVLGIKMKFRNHRKEDRNRQIEQFNTLKNLIQKQQEQNKCFENRINKRLVNLSDKTSNQIKHFIPKPYLTNIAVDISKHCNLNCRGCDHFSPLASPGFYDLNQYTSDIKRLAELAGENYIDRIGIMGGEPLLNPDVLKYLEVTRECCPKTKIRLVTNGILLTQQDENFWLTLKRLNIFVEYTKYDINLDYEKLDSIIAKYEVPIDVYGYNKNAVKKSYKIPLDLQGNQNIVDNFLNCFHANHCIALKDGRLYTCTVAPSIENFNKYFGYDLPLTDRDGIDIHKAQSMQEILEFLAKPIPFCKYCNVNGRSFGHDWGISKKEISEWI